MVHLGKQVVWVCYLDTISKSPGAAPQKVNLDAPGLKLYKYSYYKN